MVFFKIVEITNINFPCIVHYSPKFSYYGTYKNENQMGYFVYTTSKRYLKNDNYSSIRLKILKFL